MWSFRSWRKYLVSPCPWELAPIALGGETAAAVTLSRVPGFWPAGALSTLTSLARESAFERIS